MKKRTILILAYVVIVAALVVSVKLLQVYTAHHLITSKALLADCSDPTPGPSSGE